MILVCHFVFPLFAKTLTSPLHKLPCTPQLTLKGLVQVALVLEVGRPLRNLDSRLALIPTDLLCRRERRRQQPPQHSRQCRSRTSTLSKHYMYVPLLLLKTCRMTLTTILSVGVSGVPARPLVRHLPPHEPTQSERVDSQLLPSWNYKQGTLSPFTV